MSSSNKFPSAIDEDHEKEGNSEKRETWGHSLDFFMTLLGYSVGFGNVWRFPYLCYRNGGGAFLIPYLVCIIVAGFPISYLEAVVGQFMNKGGLEAWSIVPVLQGIGMATSVSTFIGSLSYIFILALCLYYMVASFTSELPWENCGHAWNTPSCLDKDNIYSENLTRTLNKVQNSENITRTMEWNSTDPVAEYFENKVLEISGGLEELGSIRWEMTLYLLASWIIVCLCTFKGVKTSGKIMYFTATSPFLLLTILLIRNCTLDGSMEGIKYFLEPDITRLADTAVWQDAGSQVFFSWSLGTGFMTMAGSYNKFHHNTYRDTYLMCILNAATSLLSGVIVFSLLGFMAKQQNVLVSDVAESGPGLTFIVYPKAVVQLPLSPLWSILFFATLVLLGLDTQIGTMETIVTAIVDQYPRAFSVGHRKHILVVLLCLVSFLLGLPLVTESGMYLFKLLDYYGFGRTGILVVFAEVVSICWLYGVDRFVDNICMMVGYSKMRCSLPYLKVCWAVLCPIFCLAILLMSSTNSSGLSYNRPNRPKYEYPEWSKALGWCVATLPSVCILLVAVYRILRLVWMGGRLRNGDFHLLIVPYSLSEHQKRPQDKQEKCLADFEENNKGEEQRNILPS